MVSLIETETRVSLIETETSVSLIETETRVSLIVTETRVSLIVINTPPPSEFLYTESFSENSEYVDISGLILDSQPKMISGL